MPEPERKSWRVCSESPAEPRSRRAVLVGALLAVASPLLAQTGNMRIHVVDVNGAMITTATVSLRGKGKRARRSAKTNAVGEVVWTDLPMGNFRIAVEAPGLSERRLTAVLRNSDEMKIEVVLEVAAMYEMAPIKSPPDASPR